MFDRFGKADQSPQPEDNWEVSLDADLIRVRDKAGAERSVARSALSAVAIETNDSGPWGADLWWLLFDADDRLACAFPQGATGEQAAVDYLLTLPIFDHDAMVRAMASTGNAIFPVWRRPV